FALLEALDAHAASSDATLRRVSSDASVAEPPRPRLPFDEEAYTLAWQVFLANRNLADAYEVAASAVRQAPGALEWRRRLAQLAEWTGRGAVALEQWTHLARAGGDPRDWSRVETLAAQLLDGPALLEALRVRARRGSDEALDLRIARLIEEQGRPREALDWLAARIAARGLATSAALVDRRVDLLESLGDSEAAARELDRVDAALGASPVRAMRRASIRLARGDVAGAFDALHAVRDAVAAAREAPRAGGDPGADTYWHLYARLASRLQREADADLAYRRLVRDGLADAGVLAEWSALLEPRSPRAAARVAEAAWRADPVAGRATGAFLAWLRAGDFDAIERLLAAFDAPLRASLAARADYLQALALHRQSLGDDAGARRALERAIAAAPDDAVLRASLLWATIARRDAAALRAALDRAERGAVGGPALWGPIAAGWMALDEPRRALPWFVRRARDGGGDDYLWQLGLADCLERLGRVDAAWSLRRRAWLELRRETLAGRRGDGWREQAVLSLAMRFAPADAAREALARTVAVRAPSAARTDAARTSPPAPSPAIDAGVGPEALLARVDADLAAGDPPAGGADPLADRAQARALAAGARELALSWLLTREASDAARAWLLSRYAEQLARPAWARLSIALADGDRPALAGLLDELPDWLPRLDAIEAMRATGRHAEARAAAWSLHEARPDADEAHRRLVETLLPDASFAQLDAISTELGPLGLSTLRTRLQRTLGTGLALGLSLDRDRLRSLDAAALDGVPGDSTRVGLGVGWRGERARLDAEVSRLRAARETTGLRLALRPQPDGDRGPSLVLGLGQTATESAALRAAGVRDHAELRWGAALTARDRIVASVAPTRLGSQDGTTLATGTVWSLQATHRLRLETPDVALRAVLVRADWRARDAVDSAVVPLVPGALDASAVVPVSSTELAAGLAFGESVSQSYGRAPRPFGELLARTNSASGAGYALRAGFTLAPTGADRLTAFASLISATPGIPRASRTFGLAYQHLF
ncbi:MAG TPA: tetratricopeptide repeat protein, partial [Burkholderiaceae bacterium]|nr:tetratricopeptide repeat protein [Burkholderiaceae bacterium]